MKTHYAMIILATACFLMLAGCGGTDGEHKQQVPDWAIRDDEEIPANLAPRDLFPYILGHTCGSPCLCRDAFDQFMKKTQALPNRDALRRELIDAIAKEHERIEKHPTHSLHDYYYLVEFLGPLDARELILHYIKNAAGLIAVTARP